MNKVDSWLALNHECTETLQTQFRLHKQMDAIWKEMSQEEHDKIFATVIEQERLAQEAAKSTEQHGS